MSSKHPGIQTSVQPQPTEYPNPLRSYGVRTTVVVVGGAGAT
jgi:hypothetical protein